MEKLRILQFTPISYDFAVYALMSKIGVKCEIHDCTIALFACLFKDSVPRHIIKEFRQSKDDRVDLQYYPKEIKINTGHLTGQTKSFVLQIEEMIDRLNTEKIAVLQNKVKDAISARTAPDNQKESKQAVKKKCRFYDLA